VITISDLAAFLEEHEHPDRVVVHPLDFIEIQRLVVPEKHGTNIFWFLGVEWIRDGNPGSQLNWGHTRIPRIPSGSRFPDLQG